MMSPSFGRFYSADPNQTAGQGARHGELKPHKPLPRPIEVRCAREVTCEGTRAQAGLDR
jgi:hypothetical protein